MRFLQSLFLVVVLAVCYLFFFRSQAVVDPSSQPATKAAKVGIPFPAPQPQSQYKRDIDRAHAVANQMKESHKEADSY